MKASLQNCDCTRRPNSLRYHVSEVPTQTCDKIPAERAACGPKYCTPTTCQSVSGRTSRRTRGSNLLNKCSKIIAIADFRVFRMHGHGDIAQFLQTLDGVWPILV